MQAVVVKEEFQKKSVGFAIYKIIKEFIEHDAEIIRDCIKTSIEDWEKSSGEGVSLICEVGPRERIAIMNDLFPLIENHYLKIKKIDVDESISAKFEQAYLNYVGLETNPMVNCHSLLCNQIIGK